MLRDYRENRQIQRIAAWIWVGYLLALALVDTLIYVDQPTSPMARYYWMNGLAALLFLSLAYWRWGQERLNDAYPILMILLITVVPILLHHLILPKLPPGPLSNAEGVTLRQWPVHFIALVLVSWQYSLGTIIVFSLGTATLDILTILVFKHVDPGTFTIIVFVTVIRTVSFLVIGIFIHRLMSRLRAQQSSLYQANVQLRHYASALETLTITRERNRMARELHDTLAHTLSGLSVQLETVKAYWDVEPETAQNLLDQSLTATRSGLDETRRAMKSLRATPLKDLGLGLAIRELAESASDRSTTKLSLALPEQIPPLPPDVEQCIYRVSQEAIENAIQHANAQNMAVSLTFGGDSVILEVWDDGLGFDVQQTAQPGHFGLSGMRERAQLAGGELIIDSQPGNGTLVRLVLQGDFDESDHL